MADIPIYASCKFVMYRFTIVLVIKENERFVFLYVLTEYSLNSSQQARKSGDTIFPIIKGPIGVF